MKEAPTRNGIHNPSKQQVKILGGEGNLTFFFDSKGWALLRPIVLPTLLRTTSQPSLSYNRSSGRMRTCTVETI